MDKAPESGIARCDRCNNLYDHTKRKYWHSCPYCNGDVFLKPRHECGWTDEALYNYLKDWGYGAILKDKP